MSTVEDLQKLFINLEHMLETQTLTKEKLEEFWEEVSALAEEQEDVDKELLETMKNLVNEMTATMDFEVAKPEETKKVSRVPRDTSMLSSVSKPNESQVSQLKPMLILWTGFFAGTAISYKFFKKPLNPVTKTVITTFAAKAAEKGFDQAYQEFQSMVKH